MSPAPAATVDVNVGQEGRETTVRVSILGGEQRTADFTEGLTLREYLTNAGAEIDPQKTATLNGEPAELDDPVPANSVLVYAGNVGNG